MFAQLFHINHMNYVLGRKIQTNHENPDLGIYCFYRNFKKQTYVTQKKRRGVMGGIWWIKTIDPFNFHRLNGFAYITQDYNMYHLKGIQVTKKDLEHHLQREIDAIRRSLSNKS